MGIRMRWTVAALLAGAAGCAWPAAGVRAVAGAPLALTSMRLTLTPEAVPANGRARTAVLASVTPALPGIEVHFATSGDSRLAAATATTDSAGRASDVLTASYTPGTQTVSVTSDLGSASVTLTQVEVRPVELVAPAAGIDAPILGVGVNPQGAMDAPQGPPGDPVWQRAFWLRTTSVPGFPGTAALSGHLDDHEGRPAAFWTLAWLRPGDEVVARLSDGDRARFRVTDVHVYTEAQAGSPAVTERFYGRPGDARRGGPAHLTLMTCAGSFRDGRGFDHRFVAFADRLPD
jgi:hypothetical protein